MSENSRVEIQGFSNLSSDNQKFQLAQKESEDRPRYTRLIEAAALCKEVSTGNEDSPYTNGRSALINFEYALLLVSDENYSSHGEPAAERMFHLYLLYNLARICLELCEQQVKNINNLKEKKTSFLKKQVSNSLKIADNYLAQAFKYLNIVKTRKNLLNSYELFNFYRLWAVACIAKGRLASTPHTERDKFFFIAQQNYIEALKIVPKNSVAGQQLADSAQRNLKSAGILTNEFLEWTSPDPKVLEDKKNLATNATRSAFKMIADKANLIKKYNNTLDFLLKGVAALTAQENILTNCKEKINQLAVDSDDAVRALKSIKVTTDAAHAAVNVIHKKIKACKTNLELAEKMLGTAQEYGGELDIPQKKQQLEEITTKIQQFDQSMLDNQLATFFKSAEDIQQLIEKNIAAALIKKNQPLNKSHARLDQAKKDDKNTHALKLSKSQNPKKSGGKVKKITKAQDQKKARDKARKNRESKDGSNTPALGTRINPPSAEPKEVKLNVDQYGDLKRREIDSDTSLANNESQSPKESVVKKIRHSYTCH